MKKDFETYCRELTEARNQAEAEMHKSQHALQQEMHRLQRAENIRDNVIGKKNKQRNRRLIHKGLAVETILKDTELMTDSEFYELFEEMADDPAIVKAVSEITAGRRDAYEEEQKRLHELQLMAAAEKRRKRG